MRIGLDVDGVLTNLEKYQLQKGIEYFGKEKLIDESAYDIREMFGCTEEERERFWIKYIWEYCLLEKSRDGASELTQKLKSNGDYIYIITGRAHTTEKNMCGILFRKMLIYKLKKDGIKYDDIFFCNENNSANEKYEICKRLNLDVMIDDKVENVKEIKKICKVIMPITKNNHDYCDDQVMKTIDLFETLSKVEEIRTNITKKTSEFRFLSLDEKELLTETKLKEYYQNLKRYYQNLPYDTVKMKKLERNYSIAVTIGISIFKLLYKPIIINKEFIPKGNGYIFVSNHLGSLDQFPIMAAIGNRPIHFMAASTLLKLRRGKLYKHTGSIFVDRENPESRKSARELMNQVVLNNGNVFIFPEGTRNRSEKFMLEFKLGAASIAQNTGAQIVPFAVNNNYKINGNKLIVRVGKPMSISYNDDIVEKTDELKEIIGTMIWENMELEKQIDEETKKLKKRRK